MSKDKEEKPNDNERVTTKEIIIDADNPKNPPKKER